MIASLLASGLQLNSLAFLLFLAVSLALYYLLPQKLRNPFLLVASYAFYCIHAWQYAALLLAVTALSYATAHAISRQDDPGKRRALRTGCIVLMLAVLAFFKYVIGPLAQTLAQGGAISQDIFGLLILPVGISYYTFRAIGYIVDVYNKKVAPEASFVRYALFLSFFPQVLAGPIGRAGELLPQFGEPHAFSYSNMSEGLQRFLAGAFRKVVVADGLALIVNGVFDQLESHSGPLLILATFLYPLQLFADFSGYSDMAVGAAKMFGFTLRENFRAPYFATSMGGLWQRWHMSLTTWLTDYIFTPLVWSRWYNKLFFGKKADEHAPAIIPNIIIVFFISGLWHGDNLNFVIWGVLQGLLRAGEELAARARKKKGKKLKDERLVVKTLKRAWVYLAWVLTHVFFKVPTLKEAGYVFTGMFRFDSTTRFWPGLFQLITGSPSWRTSTIHLYFFILLTGLVIMTLLDYRIYTRNVGNALGPFSKKRRWALYWVMGIAVMIFYFMALSSGSPPVIYGAH